MKCISRDNVRHTGKQGLKLSFWVEVKDPVFSPGTLSRHQFVLGATQRMEGMSDVESACGGSHTLCI